MKKIQCSLCGSINFTCLANGMIQCDMCGCKYTTQQAQTIISGTVEVVSGETEIRRRLAQKDTYVRFGEYLKAIGVLEWIQQEHPHDFRGWNGALEVYYLFMTIQNLSKTGLNFGEGIPCYPEMGDKKYPSLHVIKSMAELANKAQMTAPDEKTRINVKQKWDAWCQALAQGICTGKIAIFDLANGCFAASLPRRGLNGEEVYYNEESYIHSGNEYHDFKAWLEQLSSVHVAIRDVFQQFINAAKTIHSSLLTIGVWETASAEYGYNRINCGWLPYNPSYPSEGCNMMVLPEGIVVLKKGRRDYSDVMQLIYYRSGPTTLSRDFVAQKRIEATRNAMNFNFCPVCGTRGEKKFLSQKCHTCGKIF